MRNEGEDVETQRRSVGVGEAGRDKDTSRLQVDVADTRRRRAAAAGRRRARARRSRRPGATAATRPSDAAALLDDLEPDELEGVVLVLLRSAAAPRAAPRAPCPRATGRSSRITGRPPAPRRATTTSASSPPASSRAPDLEPARSSSLGSSTKNAPSSPCGRPTRPTSTRSGAGQPAISTSTRRPSRAELARTTVRSARTIRPPRPITLPTSSGRDVQAEDERAVALLALHAHRIGVVDELAREIREQLGHGC